MWSAKMLSARRLIERTDTWLRDLFVRQVQHLRERLQDEPNGYERDELKRLLTEIDNTLKKEVGTQPR